MTDCTGAVGRRRLLERLYVAAVLGWIVAIQLLYFERGFIPGDALVYLAAGERLNDGHPLYALMPGDRPSDINPPYWRIPLVSPPLIAVLWRPLALLGEAAPYLWWSLQAAALVTAVAMLLRGRPVITATALLILSVPFVYEFSVGNVNSFILLALVVGWRAFAAGRPAAIGALAGIAAVVKVTPVLVAWWAIVADGKTARLAVLVAGAAALAVGLIGAGLDNHAAYLAALGRGDVSFSPLSVGGALRYLGVAEPMARALVAALIVGAIALVWRFRARPDRAFQVAVVATIAASPAVSINWFVLLLATLAPVVWPLPTEVKRSTA